ncbi:DUF2460 domain-containing protein [Aurantiacibacter aquimixticola]|uniref:TIGR02217 family protein n=1 Tax=Aurantiacibacter aquimixticola TaxID=1958945 RepID=A0A419RV72_9SPHN|nr:DUF2460 domain-containing protein [Aurantiacibacter aquimixticola]RJY09685.1 TIGR02217 family protein [Aurantiacibacter aquimixticola]
MAYWLAKDRTGQDSDFIQRFDPRFWTVDFPRPMMASITGTGPTTLRVECEFLHHDALAGLIWDSEDTLDHPLLAYDTNRDYAHTSLTFRWRSAGVLPLDAVHGPTLTIEGRDAGGASRTWYVRLWNYASGAPDDAVVSLDFSQLREGWQADGAVVHPSDIDRLFISLVPPAYDPANGALLTSRANGWVELFDIASDGAHAMLPIGDVMLPPHDIGMATAYDDAYNQTPARLLRNTLQLGYRGEIIHYVGMSHFFRLEPAADGTLLVERNGLLCGPAETWHRAFFEEALAMDYQVIASISFEIFAEHCPPDWMQRAHDGSPALTGWVPPSSLISPANNAAKNFVRGAAARFGLLQEQAGMDVVMQVGEPWWWIQPDTGAPCIYDDAARSVFSNAAPPITDMRGPITAAQLVVLDEAAKSLGFAANSVRNRVRQQSGSDAKCYLLAFTPTIFDADMPEADRLNLPSQWAHPQYDRLQLEDYDWLTLGAEALRRKTYTEVDQRLGYPLGQQDYMAGFVLDPADAELFWARIDAGLDEAAARGVPRRFVWALPQVCRDGYVRLPPQETPMQAFDDVLYPLALGRDAGVSPEFSTSIALTASGHERRNSQWSDARLNYDVGPGIRSHSELGVLLEFFRARRGPARGFRLADPYDFSSNGLTGTPTASDQLIGVGDGLAATYHLSKSYGSGDEPQQRTITRPRADSILVSVAGEVTNDWTLEDGGRIIFIDAPPDGAEVRAGFYFDVPVRFAEDRLDITGATFAAGEAPSVPLIEVKEET